MSIKELVDPFTGKQVKEGKYKAPLGAVGERVAVGRPFDEPIGPPGVMPYGGSAYYRHGW